MLGRAVVVLVACLGAVVAGTAPAQAASPRPWMVFHEQDRTVAAGAACDFPVNFHVVADAERFRITETHADGSPALEQFTGLLVIRFTNLDSGASVVRNLTGRGDFLLGEDGSFTLTDIGGHFAAALPPGSDPGPGIFVVTGTGFSVSKDASGHWVFDTSGHGVIEDLCDTLAG